MRHSEIGGEQRDDEWELGEDDELLTLDESCAFIGGRKKPIHPSNFYRGIQRGDYHQPMHPTPGISSGGLSAGWRASASARSRGADNLSCPSKTAKALPLIGSATRLPVSMLPRRA